MSDTSVHQPDSAAAAPAGWKGITLSDSAVAKLRSLIAAESKPGAMLRIAVNGGGCSGFTYSFDIDTARNDDDRAWQTNDVVVVVDEASLAFIDGSVLNSVETPIGRAHVWTQVTT